MIEMEEEQVHESMPESVHQDIPQQESFTQRRFYLLTNVWDFLKVRKKWWLLPIILMMFFVGVLIVFGQSSAVSPFVYALF